MERDISRITDTVQENSSFVSRIRQEMSQVVVGQENMVDKLLTALIADGHILLEGLPGLAKTLSISTLARIVNTGFKRLQFTPDLLPADLIGTMIYDQKNGEFVPKKGPLFSNFILADEVNRAPAKVQSALLEAMQERQVTIGDTTYALEQPFLVMATQNPVDQEGTYQLPEAQVDRFMLKVKITYPSRDEEMAILRTMSSPDRPQIEPVASVEDILAARSVIPKIYMDPRVEEYLIDLVMATRSPKEYGLADFSEYIEYGASPRGTLALAKCARVTAFLHGRGYVTPEDIKSVGFDVLNHRIATTYEADAENVVCEDIVRAVFDSIEVP
ncbi:AAA family ATPase [Chitinivibrio alkaliphilus]|uniref:ATPase associated with various cellular activities (AAA superfamily) n=1 Tax=Chitinivibrio alkaliphilus ACht1 TaxID=1313304 RepID=U7DAR0_9BACT|nr:MoxR family ATPase [Chitinivibrio alkaliphilus]ERP39117.1 ATPase associated with various cellular activities (AAA superfamily) [Chitinivibrio alkaliphilus ACht1]